MNTSTTSLIALTMTAACVLFTSPARAQPTGAADSGVVSGTGRALIERRPELMRMELVLTAEGKDVKEAMSKLKEKQEATRKDLAKLGAAEKSVELGDPRVGGAAGNNTEQQRRYVAMMMRQRAAGNKAAAAGAKGPATVTVSSTVKAEWPLKADESAGPEALVVAGYELREKVKASGLGKAEAKPLTPEEEEMMEEAAGMMNDFDGSGGNAPKPGEPTFRFVAKVTEEQRSKAAAEAFARARSDAAGLAKAAGAELGPLAQLSAMTGPANPGGAGDGSDNAYYGGYGMFMGRRGGSGDPDQNEASGAEPGPVGLQVVVTAAFRLK